MVSRHGRAFHIINLLRGKSVYGLSKQRLSNAQLGSFLFFVGCDGDCWTQFGVAEYLTRHDAYVTSLLQRRVAHTEIATGTTPGAAVTTVSPIWHFRFSIGHMILYFHYGDVIMGAITSLMSVYSTVYSDADQRKHQSAASLAFVRGIHLGPVNSPHKWPVTRKLFPFDDVIVFWFKNILLDSADTPAGPLFTKTVRRLTAKSRKTAILDVYNDRTAQKFDRQLGSAAAGLSVKFQSDRISLNLNHAASRLHEILR